MASFAFMALRAIRVFTDNWSDKTENTENGSTTMASSPPTNSMKASRKCAMH